MNRAIITAIRSFPRATVIEAYTNRTLFVDDPNKVDFNLAKMVEVRFRDAENPVVYLETPGSLKHLEQMNRDKTTA